MSNIVIIGCSWGCGEWSRRAQGRGHARRQTLLHGGTGQYLSELGHRVVNLSHPGDCNHSQVERLRPQHVRHVDHIIWFMTDPMRDLCPRGDNSVEGLMERSLAGYLAQRERLLRTQVDRMRHLPVIVVGGVCAVPLWVTQECPRWRVACRDLRGWLLPDREPIETLGRTWRFPDCELDLLEHWERDEHVSQLHEDRAREELTSLEHHYFWPDGGHPNRRAHERLTQELIRPLL